MKTKLKSISAYSVLIIGGITVLFPFVWMLLSSFKTRSEASAIPPVFIPETFMISNYLEVFQQTPFLLYTLNSIIAALFSTIFVLFTSIMAAFAFAKFEFKFKNIILSFLLATMMIPGEMLIITNFQTISSLNLIDTRIAIFLPYSASVFYLYMILQFFQTVPHELYLAAKVDGTSDFKFLIKVLVPISKPIIVTVALLNIIGSWNAYLWPALVTNSDKLRTLPYGLVGFTGEAGSDVQLIMAASTMIVLPLIILFISTRKFIISGLTQGAIKG